MRIVKNINNNVAVCVDSQGREIVAFAKGIGFKKPPSEIELSEIERTFYHVDPSYIDMIQNADEKVIAIAMDVKRYSDAQNIITSNSLLYSLIDHIGYSIERMKKGIYFNLPITSDIPHLFQKEIDVGKYALKLIKERLGIDMPKDEASFIALNIINSETELANQQKREDMIIEHVVQIISQEMKIQIDVEGINYSRFESHLRYLMIRSQYSDRCYEQLLETVAGNYPEEYSCAKRVIVYLEREGYGPFNDDETLFFFFFFNRLCFRESK